MDFDSDFDEEKEKEIEQEFLQHEYNLVSSLLFNWQDAVVPRDKYWFKPDDDGKAWILLIKPGVRLVPKEVSTVGQMGFIFHFEDNMTPRPFDEGWKVTFMKMLLGSHTLYMASPTHTYLCLRVKMDFDDEIESEDNDVGLMKLSWAASHPSLHNLP